MSQRFLEVRFNMPAPTKIAKIAKIAKITIKVNEKERPLTLYQW